jgi:glycosyltransferase involved in cell wall biosynthesis
MARICIVTPAPLGSNPRVVKEADALAEAGHEVLVVSTRVLDEVDRRDDEVLKHARWESRRIDLRRRLGRAPLRLLQAGMRSAHRLTGPALWPAQAHSIFSMALAGAVRGHRADLYIGHYVPALPVVARAAAGARALYGFDAEDFHPGDLADKPEHAYDNDLIRRIEGRWLPGCAYVTAASPGIADAYAQAYGMARPQVILNAFPASRAPPGPTSRGQAEQGPSIYWFSQVIGPERGLECAVLAIAQARTEPHLYLRGGQVPGYSETLRTLATRHGVGARLHLLAPEAPDRMEALAAGYDLGLVAENGATPNHRIALSNKQFTYLLAGLPVVMSDTPGHRAFAEAAPGAAALFETESADSLARVLDDLLGDPARLARARAIAYELGQTRFNWEIEKQKLIACVEASLAA